MTSRVSLFKLFKENFKRHLTSILIVSLIFIIHFISILIETQSIADNINYYSDNYAFERALELMSPNVVSGMIAIGIGLYLAFDYFRYMHSRKESDFYDSLPILRQEHFMLNCASSITTFAAISAFTLALELLVINLFGLGDSLITKACIWNYVTMLLCFLASWVTGTLAMIMTGNFMIALLGYGVFTVYFPIILNNLIPLFSEVYFDTYYSMPTFNNFNWNELLEFISPAYLMYKMINFRTEFWEFAPHSKYFLITIIFILAVGILAFKLHKNRPAESAGRAMAFEKANSYIRVLIVIPLALYGGLLFKEITSVASNAWLIFGVLFTGLIIHCIMQAIFEFDVRAIFTKKRQLLLSYVICIGFISIFYFDVFQYNEYLPDVSKVNNIYIDVDNVHGYSDFDNRNGLSPENIVLALETAKDIVSVDENLNVDDYEAIDSVVFKYELKNGITISREYLFNIHAISPNFDKLYAQKDFKDDTCILYDFKVEDYTSMYISEFHTNIDVPIKRRQELIDTYLSEYTEFTLSEHYKTPIVFNFGVEYYLENENGNKHEWNSTFYVYESFEKTIALLKDIGFKSLAENEDIQLTTLEIYDDAYEEGYVIDNLEILKEIKPHIYSIEYNYNIRNEEWVHCWATFSNSTEDIFYDIIVPRTIIDTYVK